MRRWIRNLFARRPSSRAARLGVEALDRRDVPSITWVSDGGPLGTTGHIEITGNATNDVVSVLHKGNSPVSDYDDQIVVIREYGAPRGPVSTETATFNLYVNYGFGYIPRVTGITATLGNGSNHFDNATGVKCAVTGGTGADEFFGGTSDDFLNGEGGADTLEGGGGADIINGGGGDDTLRGDDGDDQLYGGDDQDTLYGGKGDDQLYGGDQNDQLYGEEDDDDLMGWDGNDILNGGGGHDELSGDVGNDFLVGGDGWDRLEGGAGDDTLGGGAGNDTLYGEDDADVLLGGDHNDRLYGGAGADKLNGGSGTDGLYGGDGADELKGEGGSDRFLQTATADTVHDFNAALDVTVTFANTFGGVTHGETTFASGVWAQDEVEEADVGLAVMHDRVGNASLLKYNGTGLTIRRTGLQLSPARGPDDGGIIAWNSGATLTMTAYAFAYPEVTHHAIIHEVGHNFDTEWAFGHGWKGLSGWTNANPNSPAYAKPAEDSNWWYKTGSQFVSDYAMSSPSDDFAESFAAYFMDRLGEQMIGTHWSNLPPGKARPPDKVQWVDDTFLDAIAT